MKHNQLAVAFAFVLAGTWPLQGQQLDTLSLEQAVALSLQYQPSLRGAEASVRVAVAAARQARAGFFPSVTFAAIDTRTGGTSLVNPAVPPSLRTYSNYSAAMQGNLTIWDFGKTSGRLSQNDFLADAATDDYTSARENLAVSTEVAYFAFLQARRVVRVNEEALGQASRHLAQAKAFYTVGRRPQIDVTKAEVDLQNANVNLIIARNALRVAKLQLENTMGVHPTNEYAVSDSFTVPITVTTLDSAQTSALHNRPELIAARARVDAARAGITAARGGHLPTVAAFGGYTWNGFEFPLVSRWNAGVSFTLPIFQGFSLTAQVQQAEANADIAQASLDVLGESVLLDVEQQFLAVREASERALATAKLVQQSEENLNLVERQYAAGVSTALDESDAQLTLSNARITDIQAQYDYRSAVVRLRRAMGLSVLPPGL